MHKLKIIRVTVACFVLVAITLYFIDFTGLLPESFKFLTRIQWVPALLMVTPLLTVLILLSLFAGRFFCSAICPLGILQDVMIRFTARFQKGKKHKYAYQKSYGWIRYGVLLLTFISFVTGSSAVLLWLDPYSNFGRIITNLIRPGVIAINNLAATVFSSLKLYSVPVYRQEIAALSYVSLAAVLVILIVLFLFTWRHGRMYCNVVCPVGTFLGMLSKVSLFRIRINQITCTSCGLCESYCKGGCIDTENKTVDVSRCVSCFNCLRVCKKGGVGYKYVAPSSDKLPKPAYFSRSRREALTVTSALLGSAVASGMGRVTPAKIEADKAASRKAIMPPGANDRLSFNRKCTACHLCITKCPNHILTPATTHYGVSGILEPTVSYKKGYCNYNCTICSDVCPTGALQKADIKEKRLIRIGVAQLRLDLCIVPTKKNDCGACAEHCPTQAVKMVPYENGLTIPTLDQRLCIGCGGCEFICPIRPYQAIYVEGLELQSRAASPEENQSDNNKVQDFGF
ncbi:MAG: 4Fe-4S dicluster domain-containing protein [Bacteroidales bacterium]